jgi:biopolymer transport protein ExbD
MASLGPSDDDDLLASINIIPFVDIVLVVLTIFMLTSTVIVRASLEVKLPRAASAGAGVSTTLNLMLTRAGELRVNGAPRTLADARAIVADTARQHRDAQAVISDDRGVEYGRVIEVIDLVKSHGITSFALDVERAAPEPGHGP